MMQKAVTSVLFFFTTLLLYGQEVPLIEKLNELAENSEVTFSYDADLVRDIKVGQRISSVSDLNKLFASGALAMEEAADNEYLIVPRKSEIRLLFSNALSEGEEVLPFYLDVVRGEREVLYQNFISDPTKPLTFQWFPKPGDSISVISSAHDPVVLNTSHLLLDLKYEVALKEKITYLDEVVIENYLAKGIALDVPDHSTTIKMDDLALIPGETDGDVLASIATLPGINTPDSRPGNLFIRGSSSDQNFLIFNNIPIYHRGHYFGSISPYNPAVISQVTVYKNGFHPRMGGRVGGAIEMRSQDQLNQYDQFGVGINSLYGNAFVRTKIGKRLGVSLAARRSLPSSFITPKLSEISDMVYAATALTDPQLEFDLSDVDVVYEDYNLNAIYQINESNQLKISGLVTHNSTNYLSGSDSTRAQETHSFGNDGLSMEWHTNFSDRISGKLMGYYSNYHSVYERIQLNTRRNISDSDRSENGLEDAMVTYEVTNRGAGGNQWSAGFSSQWIKATFQFADDPPNNPPFRARDDQGSYIQSLFANYRFNGSGKFYFQIGGRGSYYSSTSSPYLSPRLLVNYDISNDLILKGSAGRYYQFLSQVKYLQFGSAGFDNELWRLAGHDNLQVLRSDQMMVGSILTKGKWVFDLELFKKNIDNVNYSDTPTLQPGTDYATADWEVMGLDLFTKVQIAGGLSMWGSYEYTDHVFSFDSLESVSYDYKYNQPHRFKLGGLYQKGRWKFSFSFKQLSGLYGRSLDILSELDRLTVREVVQVSGGGPGGGGMGGPGGGMGMGGGMQPPSGGTRVVSRPATLDDIPERYSPFSSLDIFVTYHLPKNLQRKWSATFGLSLINVLKNTNQIDQVVRGSSDNRNLLARNAIGFAPNLNISITW